MRTKEKRYHDRFIPDFKRFTPGPDRLVPAKTRPICLLSIILMALIVLSSLLAVGCDKPNPVPTPAPSLGTGSLAVLFINVGKADAILIQSAGKAFLIDTGTKESVPQLLRALNLYGVQALDAVFLTHTHADHIGGMPYLARYLSIGTMYSAEISMPDKNGVNKMVELAESLSLTHKQLKKGDFIPITGNLGFEVLGPLIYNGADDNDNSLVLRLKANGKTLLFTGDMQFAEEATLLAAKTDLAADILKVGNHGNPDATSAEFAAAVSPAYAVITTNTDEDADSANPRVKAALNKAQIFVTQDYPCGVRMIVSDDGSVGIENPKAPSRAADIALTRIAESEQTLTVQNNGAAAADLSGFFLLSEKGTNLFVFPQGSVLNARQSATISTQAGKGDYHWADTDKLWNAKKADAFILYDRFGNELSRISE